MTTSRYEKSDIHRSLFSTNSQKIFLKKSLIIPTLTLTVMCSLIRTTSPCSAVNTTTIGTRHGRSVEPSVWLAKSWSPLKWNRHVRGPLRHPNWIQSRWIMRYKIFQACVHGCTCRWWNVIIRVLKVYSRDHTYLVRPTDHLHFLSTRPPSYATNLQTDHSCFYHHKIRSSDDHHRVCFENNQQHESECQHFEQQLPLWLLFPYLL